MAIYHLSVKTISRSAGRSATAAAAYRAGCKIIDEQTGEVHDYRRKRGVESTELVLPADAPSWAADRAALWNAAETAEKRKNSTVAREFEIALPDELSAADRRRLAHDFARELVERHGCAADVAIHAPGGKGDNRNHHAHILLTTRRLTPTGLAEKTRELDDQTTGAKIVTEWRERFADLQNERLHEAGKDASVDHRTLEAQGIEREPGRHLGPTATAIERRGRASRKRRNDQEASVAAIEQRRAIATHIHAVESELRALEDMKAELQRDRVLAEQADKKARLAAWTPEIRAEADRRWEERMAAERARQKAPPKATIAPRPAARAAPPLPEKIPTPAPAATPPEENFMEMLKRSGVKVLEQEPKPKKAAKSKGRDFDR